MHCLTARAQSEVELVSALPHREAWVSIGEVLLRTAPMQWGGALHEFHCPLPPRGAAVQYKS